MEENKETEKERLMEENKEWKKIWKIQRKPWQNKKILKDWMRENKETEKERLMEEKKEWKKVLKDTENTVTE